MLLSGADNSHANYDGKGRNLREGILEIQIRKSYAMVKSGKEGCLSD